MAYTVYALKSEKDGRIYVGLTGNLPNRIEQHNAGKTKSTRAYTPWTLFYHEAVSTRLFAREREKYLKSGAGKEFLKAYWGYYNT